jgi:hypothetical protein
VGLGGSGNAGTGAVDLGQPTRVRGTLGIDSQIDWTLKNGRKHNSFKLGIRLSSTTAIQNTRPICFFGSAIGKGFSIFFFLSSPTTTPKRQLFLQTSFQERGYSDLGYAFPGIQNRSSI